MSYKVKIDIFEGPFDLLVYLIEKAGVSIYDVNISEITEQYIKYVDEIKTVDPESAAEFMVLAATLIYIKSGMLLPETENNNEDISEDPRDELADRILEYKKYKMLAENLSERMDYSALFMTKPGEDISVYTDSPIEYFNVDIDKFISAFGAFLEKRRREAEVRDRYEHIERERMTMEERSFQLFRHLKKYGRTNLEEIIGTHSDNYDIILTFITVLEMMLQHMISASQNENFDSIYLELRDGVELYAE